jgi:hypothetical protein
LRREKDDEERPEGVMSALKLGRRELPGLTLRPRERAEDFFASAEKQRGKNLAAECPERQSSSTKGIPT